MPAADKIDLLRSVGDYVDTYWTGAVADVLSEHAFGRALTEQQVHWFVKNGVFDAAVKRTYPLLLDEVAFLPGGRFEFGRYVRHEDAAPAIIIVVTGPEGPLDLLAWRPTTNSQALWIGKAFALGEEQIHPRVGPLEIRKSILSWLVANRQGIVILQPSMAWLRLRDVKELATEDVSHGEWLQRQLSPPPCNNILVHR